MDFTFQTQQIRKKPEMLGVWDEYKAELDRVGRSSKWPRSEQYHYAAFFLDNELISCVFYAPIAHDKRVTIVGAYTAPAWRRRGIYGALWEVCTSVWKSWDFEEVRSGFRKNNPISRAMQLKQGREIWEETEDHFRTRFDLTKVERPIPDQDRLKEIGEYLNRAPKQDGFWLTLRNKVLKQGE